MADISRPRQNRVTPAGEIVATPQRGLLMGNRGDLHAPDGSYSGQRYASRAWICCKLNHREGRKVTFDVPGRYYPLFFFDEAVALAAGHRPCGHCQGSRLAEFKHAWSMATGQAEKSFLSTRTIDAELHRHRRMRRPSVPVDRIAMLPNGTFVEIASGQACLVWNGSLHPWNWQGYDRSIGIANVEAVRLLTPLPAVCALASGYVPVVADFALGGAPASAPERSEISQILRAW